MNGAVGLGEAANGGGCGGGGGGEAEVTLEALRKKMADFARERDWEQFHSPRNLLLALSKHICKEYGNQRRPHSHHVGEVGELSEIFQWKGEVPKRLPGWGQREVEHLGEELADVLLYLVRLSDMCGIDLGKAALRKMELNARKYPAGQCRGLSKKHTHYSTTTEDGAAGDDNGNSRANAGEEQC